MLHKPFGGSTAERTDNCRAWHQLAKRMPPQVSTSYADTGTLLHSAKQAIFEHPDFDYFNEDFDPSFVIGMEYKGIVLDEELYATKIMPAYEAAQEIFAQYGINDYVCEQAVNLPGHDDIGGTSDMLACGEKNGKKVALCLDWKFGDGKVVEAENNRGGLFYTSLAAVTPGVDDLFEDVNLVVIAIVQPSSHRDSDYSLWEISPRMLKDYRHQHLILDNY